MFSSIRLKLTLWYTAVLALILTAFALLTYSLFVRALAQQTDNNIQEVATNLIATLEGEQDDAGEQARSDDETVRGALDEFRSPDYKFIVLSGNGRLVEDTGHISLDMPTEPASPFFTVRAVHQPFRVGRSEVTVGKSRYQLYVVYSLADEREQEESVRDIFLVSVPLSLLLAGLGGYFLARRTLGPISAMSERATEITSANLHERLPVKNAKDELGTLAGAFNDVLDRLDREFEHQRRFMADASHELRTPLAIVQGESDVALLKDERSVDEYKTSLRIVNDESKRLAKIVEDLFILARADAGGIRTEMRDLYVDEVGADCVVAVRTLADSRGVTIELSASELYVVGDENLLRRLFMNLLHNAIKYNFPGGSINVRVTANQIEIANTGRPIPDDQVELIFERFYRSHKERSDDEVTTSGSGLGLAIVKLIADLHGASIAYSRSGPFNVFTVIFPNTTGV